MKTLMLDSRDNDHRARNKNLREEEVESNTDRTKGGIVQVEKTF